MSHSGQTPVIWIRGENDRDDPDSLVISRRLSLAVVGSSTAVMTPSRLNAVIISAGWLPISGHCISHIDMRVLLDSPDSLLLRTLL